MLTLPDNPTPEQQKAVVLAIVRQSFEDTAENIQGIEPLGDRGWKTVYSADGVDYNLEYDGIQLTKWPVGGGQDG
jgi:hypothetical protein